MAAGRRRLKPWFKAAVCVAVSALILAVCFIIIKAAKPEIGSGEEVSGAGGHVSQTSPTSSKKADPVTVTLGCTGDLLIHNPILNAYKAGGYDFSDIFRYVAPYFLKYDYMAANLEVTLGGEERGYKGYPVFNSPDSLIDAVKNSGVDLLLTANNHCYDTGKAGFDRTVSVLKQKQIDHIGTRDVGDSPYLIKRIKGISFGLMNYTYETARSNGRKTLNGIALQPDSETLVDSFSYNSLDVFYAEVSERITAMRRQGADVVIMYIHWGNEYQLTRSDTQKAMAEKLADLGVDVIIGGHPHVVQPIEIINSETAGHQTVCLYSTGNAVSNQRAGLMNLKTGHTEDGMIFETTFRRDEDGNVTLDGINVLPTWVYLKSDSARHYYILPLDSENDWKSAYGVNSATEELLQKSYDRTMGIVGGGLKRFADEYEKLPLNVGTAGVTESGSR